MEVKLFKRFFQAGAKTLLVFEVLKDKQWHCRNCEYNHVASTQIAGSGGIQGLEKGSNRRPGIEIRSANHVCSRCSKKQDTICGLVILKNMLRLISYQRN